MINTVVDNHKLYNTDGEKSLFVPNSEFYNQLGTKMYLKRMTIDLFSCTYHNVNLINPAQLCTKTGGEVYYYKNFNSNFHGEKLGYDVFRILTRNGAYDLAFRVRCSDGYAVTSYTSNFIRFNAIDFELPSIDADKTIGVMMRSEGSITLSDKLSIQAALLFTNPDGERKIRIMNLYLPLEKRFSMIFRYVDQYALNQLIAKDCLSLVGSKTVVAIKELYISMIVKILSAFRSEGVTVTNPTEILVPDSLRFLCLYVLGLLKNPAFKIMGDIKADEKTYWILRMLGATMQGFVKLACPRIYKISDIQSSMTYYGYPDEETGKIIKPPM